MANDSDPLPSKYFSAGIASTALVAEPGSWINRRVETIEMLSHEETRRRVSVDFTLSDHQIAELSIEDGVVVPLSVLTKEPRRNFDLRDESGGSVPVLGKHQNGDLAHIALMYAAMQALPSHVNADVFELLSAELRRVVFDPSQDAADALGHFVANADAGDPWRAAVWEDATCRSLLATLRANYVLFAVVPHHTDRRRILKYSYGDDFNFDPDDQPLRNRLRPNEFIYKAWLPDRRRFVIDCPGAWRAASFHVEIAIPEELQVEQAVLYDAERDEFLSEVDTNVDRAALYASAPLTEDRSTIVYAEVAPERAGRTSLAAATSLVVTGLLWCGVASGLDARNPAPSVSLLLAGAALFSGLTAAQGGHRIIRRVFAASRRWLTLVALVALTASASLAMELPAREPVGVWLVCAIICAFAAARLTWSAIRAP